MQLNTYGALGVDVGGTTIKARLCDATGSTLGEWRQPTPRHDADGRRTVAAVMELWQHAAAVRPITSVGVAIPGIVNEATGTCEHSVNLGWSMVPIGTLVQEKLRVPVVVTHDVRAGAVGEKASGAGRDRPGPLAFMPIGTGIAISVTRDDLSSVSGPGSGEIGQIRLTGGPHAGTRLEELASAGGIARRANRANAAEVAAAVHSGDPAALQIWQDAIAVLTDALTWLITLMAPATVVIGGGLADAGDALFDPLRKGVRAHVPEFLPVELVPAQHGSAAAAVGAAYLGQRILTATP